MGSLLEGCPQMNRGLTMDVTKIVWVATVVLTGAAAGAMVGHTFLLGRFLNWMFDSGKTDVFRETYPVFLKEKNPQLLFDHLFTLAILVTTAFNAYLYLSGKWSGLSLLAVGFQWAFVGVFFGTGFARLEAELFKQGNASPERVATFVKRNIPLCGLSSALLLASLVCLVLMRF
jgi:hypothetical protein